MNADDVGIDDCCGSASVDSGDHALERHCDDP